MCFVNNPLQTEILSALFADVQIWYIEQKIKNVLTKHSILRPFVPPPLTVLGHFSPLVHFPCFHEPLLWQLLQHQDQPEP